MYLFICLFIIIFLQFAPTLNFVTENCQGFFVVVVFLNKYEHVYNFTAELSYDTGKLLAPVFIYQ